MDKYSYFTGSTQLRGANMFQNNDGDPWYPTLVKQDIVDLKSQGANLVNFSIPGVYGARTKAFIQPYMDNMLRFATWCEEIGINFIISCRTGPGRDEKDITGGLNPLRALYTKSEYQDAFCQMWQKMAIALRGYSRCVAYDILVEPHDIRMESWQKIAINIVDAIRQYDESTPIIVPTHNWSCAAALKTWTPLERERIIYSVHQYEPYTYTNEGRNYDPRFRALSSALKLISDWKVRYRLPIIVNEFGALNACDRVDTFLDYEISQFETFGINYAIWLWEVSDPQYDYRVMDVSSSPRVMSVLRKYWGRNQG